jgi:hypothetical protein
MSGIILPGQENKPAAESKIELPTGFSSRRKGEEKKVTEKPAQPGPTAPTTPAPAATQPPSPSAQASGAAAQAGNGRGQPTIDLLFPPVPVQIRCPSCGTTYAVPLFSIVDLGANPELKGALLGGQLNVAVCPNCSTGGPLSAPLLVHEPAHQFLAVFAPMQSGKVEMQQQKAIGELTQALMRKLPTEARKGYLLQPKQFTDWNRLMEQLWGFEGVTPEMLRRQRSQSELLQSLVGLVNDRKAMEMVLQQRGRDLVDRDFFAMLDRLLMLSRSQGQNAEPLLQLRNQLLETTDVGKEIKQRQDKVRAILQGLGPNTTREQVLDVILQTWREENGQELVGSLAVALTPLLDYQFLMLLTQRIENTQNEEDRKRLEELRQLILAIQEQQAQSQQAIVQQVQQVLQAVLQAPNVKDALRQHAEYIDETFLSVLAANIQAAQRNNSTAAARRLQQVYDQAMEMLQENMPEDVRLVNRLLSAPDKAALNKLFQENRSKFNPELIASLKVLETDMRDAGRNEVADRLKSLRAQIALMI